uniref:Dentin sialophosphoprotein-like n=1 Tax=Schistosoma mansoni TaxID=6183 RepID=A0A5K4FBI4_SCHMA
MVSVGEHEIVDNEQQGASRSPDVDRESRIEATPEPIDETSWDVETITVPMPSLTEDRLQTGSVSDAVQSVSPHEDTDSHGNNSLSSTDNKEGGENVSQSGRTSDVDFGGHSTDDDSRDVDERSSVDNDVTSVTKEGQSHETERGSVAVDMDGETVTQVVGEDKMVSVGEHEIVDNEQQGASRSPDVDRESRIEATPEPIDETSWDVETITVPMPSLTEDRLQTGSVSDAVQSVSPHEDTDSHGNNSLSSTDNKEGGENVSQSGRTSDVDFGGHSTDDDSRDVDERSSVDNDVTSVTKEGQSHETERGSVAVDMDGETVTQVVGEDKMVSVGEHEIVDNEQQGASRSPDVDRESRIEATPEPIDETSWDVETITVPMPSLTEDRLQTGSVSDAVQSVSPHEDTDSHGNNSLSSTDNKEGGENVSQSGRTSDVDFGGHSTDDDSRDVDERSSVDNDVTSVTKEGQSHETERGSVAVDMDGETVTQVVGEDKMVSVGEHEIVDNEQQGASRSPDVDRESRIEATPEPIDETSWDVETITVPMPSLTEDRLQTGSVSDAVQSVSPHEDTDSHGNNSLSSTDNKEGGENVSQSGRTSDVDFGGHSTDDDSRDVDERSSVDNDVTSVTKEGQSHETERGSVAVDMDGETVTQVVGEDKMVSVGEHEIVDNEQQGASRSPDVDRESRIEATPEPIDETSWDVETITVPMPSLTEDRLQTGSVSDAVQSVSPHEDTDSHGNNSLSSTDNKEGGENVSQSGRTSDVDFGGHSTDDDSRDVDERSSVDNDVTSVTKEGQSHETERGSVAVDMDGETVTQVVGEDKMVSVGEHEIVDNEQQGASRSPDVDRESRIEATPEPIDETSWDVETITVPMPSLTEDRLQTGSVSDAVQSVSPHEDTDSHGNNSLSSTDNKEGGENVSQSGRTSDVDFGGHSTDDDSRDVDERSSVDNDVTSVTKEGQSHETERGSVAVDMDGETVTQVVGEDKMVSVGEHEIVDNEQQGASRSPDVDRESRIEATPEPIDETSWDVETITVPMPSLTEDRLQTGSVSDAVHSTDNKEGGENVSQSGRTSDVDFGGHSTDDDSRDVDERSSVDNDVTSVTKEGQSHETERGSVAVDMDGETVTQVVGEDKMVSVGEHEIVDNEQQGASRSPDVDRESRIEATPEPIDETSWDVETITVPMPSLTEDRLQTGSVSDAVQSVSPHEDTDSHGNNSLSSTDNKEGGENVSQSGRTSDAVIVERNTFGYVEDVYFEKCFLSFHRVCVFVGQFVYENSLNSFVGNAFSNCLLSV